MAIGANLVELTVERQHLTIKRIKRPNPKIPMVFKFGDGQIAVEHTGQERIDRRILKKLRARCRATARQQSEGETKCQSSNPCHGRN